MGEVILCKKCSTSDHIERLMNGIVCHGCDTACSRNFDEIGDYFEITPYE